MFFKSRVLRGVEVDYKKIYKNLCRSRKYRGHERESGYEIHHIKPRSFGGSDHKNNLVKLTYREHWLAHKLLVRFSKGVEFFKMKHAFNMMSSFNGVTYNKSYLYKIYKENIDQYKHHVGCYVINPYVLPIVNGHRSFDELLCRLRYFGIKKFILPTIKALYKYGEYTCIRNKMTYLKHRGYILPEIRLSREWRNFVIYEFSPSYKDTEPALDRYAPRHISYTDKGFEDTPLPSPKHCQIGDIRFSNPLTIRGKNPLNVLSKSVYREQANNTHYKYLIQQPINDTIDEKLLAEYKAFHGLKRVRAGDYYQTLKTLDHYCGIWECWVLQIYF